MNLVPVKVTGILATPHGLEGNTAKLLGHVLESARAQGAETEVIVLKGNNVLPCLGCDICHEEGRCPQEDEFEIIKKKIDHSHGLVLATPNYIFNVSAQLKAFMDRCCGIIHTLGFAGKYGASVITSGGGDEQPIAEYMNHFLITTGIRPVGAVWATMGNIQGDGFPPEIQENAEKLGWLLVRSITDDTVFPEIERKIESFANRMFSLVSYNQERWSYEYEYWKKRLED